MRGGLFRETTSKLQWDPFQTLLLRMNLVGGGGVTGAMSTNGPLSSTDNALQQQNCANQPGLRPAVCACTLFLGLVSGSDWMGWECGVHTLLLHRQCQECSQAGKRDDWVSPSATPANYK